MRREFVKASIVGFILSSSLFFGGCEPSVSSGGGGSANTGGASGTGGTGGESGTSGPCPTTEPMNGSVCSTPNTQCSYGESAFPRCRRRYRCDTGQWANIGGFCDPEPAACSPANPAGTSCGTQFSYCVDNGTSLCMCPICGGAGCQPEPWTWSCSGPPQSGCPDIVPNEGTTCNDATLDCEYGIMCNEYARTRCVNGIWQWDLEIACP